MRSLITALVLSLFTYQNMYAQLCYTTEVVIDSLVDIPQGDFQLVFEDNFDGDKLNTDVWRRSFPWGRTIIDHNELQYYADENCVIEDGILNLIIKKEVINKKAVSYLPADKLLKDDITNKRSFDYTAGMIHSKDKFGYGKYEIRCKLPKGKSFWPAFWLFGDAGYNEIDIFEFWNEDSFLGYYRPKLLSRVPHFNIHHDFEQEGRRQCSSKYKGPDFSQDFHTFTFEWDFYKMQWYVDGEVKRTTYRYYTLDKKPLERSDISIGQKVIVNKNYPTQEELNVIINIAINGKKDSPDKKTPFPSTFQIDYFKFFEKESSTSSTDADDTNNESSN